jgi:hypothetical protein
MFNLFGDSAPKINVIDKVWMSKEAKWKACASMLQVNPACVFIAWFEQTHNELASVLGSDEHMMLADKIDHVRLQDGMVVFAEHYPLHQKELTLFKNLNLKEVPVVSSLDEPLFMHFGGERTVELIKNLGMKEDEIIGHSMVTNSIRRAQQKLESKVKIEKMANSAREWFAINVPD